MRTELHRAGDEARFVIFDLDPVYHAGARGLGYEPAAGGFAKRFPASLPHLDAAHANFARHLEDLILQRAEVRPVPWDQTLGWLLGLLVDADLDWALVGSAALAVRGADVRPHDLDLVVDADGAHRLAGLLRDYLVEPVTPTDRWVADWFGRAFHGACVDWVGGVGAVADRPAPSDFGPAAWARLETVGWHGH